VTVISGGVERVICQTCGQVTVRYESTISRDISRAQFSRKAEMPHEGGNGKHERDSDRVPQSA
jgi:hypothetical protein